MTKDLGTERHEKSPDRALFLKGLFSTLVLPNDQSMEAKIEEIWKDVVGYEGYYQVSNIGRVRRLPTIVNHSEPGFKAFRKGRIIKQAYGKRFGYLSAQLSKEGDVRTFRVNVLVAVAFVPNPENKPQVNHINGVKTDNVAANLEWVTRIENKRHAIRMGLVKGIDASKMITRETLDKMEAMRVDGHTQPEIAKAFKVHQCTVSRALAGKRNYGKLLAGDKY